VAGGVDAACGVARRADAGTTGGADAVADTGGAGLGVEDGAGAAGTVGVVAVAGGVAAALRVVVVAAPLPQAVYLPQQTALLQHSISKMDDAALRQAALTPR